LTPAIWQKRTSNGSAPRTTLRSDSTVYALVQLALQRRGNDPQMEFAAALISVGNASINGQEHAEKALAGAKNDSLLARNLFAHFLGAQSENAFGNDHPHQAGRQNGQGVVP